MIERELGEEIAVSIATAEALSKAVLVEKPEAPNLWFNVRTLYRNLYGALHEPDRVSVSGISELLMEEMGLITALLDGVVKLQWYTTSDKNMVRHFPLAKVKVPRTKKQIAYADVKRRAVRATMSLGGVRKFEQKITGNHPKSMIITHLPLDLLSEYSFSELLLLESHTGNVKKARQWNTKLTKGRERDRIPFNVLTLQVFGDNSTQFYALPHKVKQAVLDMSVKYKWNPTTSMAKIKDNLKGVEDLEVRALLNKLANIKVR